MLTDDEYKDFEAQIKLQEKVFLAISRIFQKFSGVYSLILLSWKAKWLGINFLVEISPKQTVLIGLFFFSQIWLGLPKFRLGILRLGTLRIREKINSKSFGFLWYKNQTVVLTLETIEFEERWSSPHRTIQLRPESGHRTPGTVQGHHKYTSVTQKHFLPFVKPVFRQMKRKMSRKWILPVTHRYNF